MNKFLFSLPVFLSFCTLSAWAIDPMEQAVSRISPSSPSSPTAAGLDVLPSGQKQQKANEGEVEAEVEILRRKVAELEQRLEEVGRKPADVPPSSANVSSRSPATSEDIRLLGDRITTLQRQLSATPKKKEPVRHIMNPVVLSFLVGAGVENDTAASAELLAPVWKSAFDLSFRGFWMYTKEKSSRPHYEDSVKQANFGGDVTVLWNPFVGRTIIAPYVGGGLRWEDVADNAETLPVGRLGCRLNLQPVYINVFGVYAATDHSGEIVADIGAYLSSRTQFHVFGEFFDLGYYKERFGGKPHTSVVLGCGFSFDF